MKTVKTLLVFVLLGMLVISIGGCDTMQKMVPPVDEGGDEDITMPPVDDGDDEGTTMPPGEDSGDEDTTMPPEEPPPVVSEGPVVSILPASVTSPAVGEPLVVEIQIAGGENVFGYEFTLAFDATALRYVSSANGDYLPGAFFPEPTLENGNQVKLTAGAGAASDAEDGTLVSVTFEVVARKASVLTLSDVLLDHGGSTSVPQVANGQIGE